MNRQFGRKPHDPAQLARAPVHRFGAVVPPAVLDRRAYNYTPGLYRNDTIPDCSAVSLINAAIGVAALNGYSLAVNPLMVPMFYAACVGNPPKLEDSSGAVLLDVLGYQSRHGFDIGAQILVAKHGTVFTGSRVQLAAALHRFGMAWWGVRLLERDMEGKIVWDVQPGRDDGALAGLHAVNGWDYTGLGDDDTVRIGTWGGWQKVTWAWLMNRLDEAHALVWRQLERADGTFYAGLTADGLIADLA